MSEPNVKHLKCTHKYCVKCISDWLSKKDTCPTCRTQVSELELYDAVYFSKKNTIKNHVYVAKKYFNYSFVDKETKELFKTLIGENIEMYHPQAHEFIKHVGDLFLEDPEKYTEIFELLGNMEYVITPYILVENKNNKYTKEYNIDYSFVALF